MSTVGHKPKTKHKSRKGSKSTTFSQESHRHPSLKSAVTKVKNVRRISNIAVERAKQRVEPASNIYTINENEPTETYKTKSKRFVKLIKDKLCSYFDRRRCSVQDMREIREMAKKMPHVEKMRTWCPIPLLQPTKEHSIHRKVKRRHLELESLCCFDSCVIRGGCGAIVVAEVLYVLLTTFAIFLKFYSSNYRLWSKLELNFNAIIFHQIFLYALLIFNLVTVFMICALVKAILHFERLYAKLHWHYCFFALAINTVFLVLFVTALSSTGPESWNLPNIILVSCFLLQIPVQLWAISIVKQGVDFFNLLYVLISIAE